jgi:hypothetical protein
LIEVPRSSLALSLSLSLTLSLFHSLALILLNTILKGVGSCHVFWEGRRTLVLLLRRSSSSNLLRLALVLESLLGLPRLLINLGHGDDRTQERVKDSVVEVRVEGQLLDMGRFGEEFGSSCGNRTKGTGGAGSSPQKDFLSV